MLRERSFRGTTAAASGVQVAGIVRFGKTAAALRVGQQAINCVALTTAGEEHEGLYSQGTEVGLNDCSNLADRLRLSNNLQPWPSDHFNESANFPQRTCYQPKPRVGDSECTLGIDALVHFDEFDILRDAHHPGAMAPR